MGVACVNPTHTFHHHRYRTPYFVASIVASIYLTYKTVLLILSPSKSNALLKKGYCDLDFLENDGDLTNLRQFTVFKDFFAEAKVKVIAPIAKKTK